MRLGGFLACDLKGSDSRTSLMCGLLPSLVEMQCVKSSPPLMKGMLLSTSQMYLRMVHGRPSGSHPDNPRSLTPCSGSQDCPVVADRRPTHIIMCRSSLIVMCDACDRTVGWEALWLLNWEPRHTAVSCIVRKAHTLHPPPPKEN